MRAAGCSSILSGFIFRRVFAAAILAITAGIPASAVDFSKHTIDDAINGPVSLQVYDLDSDLDTDIIVALANQGAVCWYENNGAGEFTRRTVDDDFPGAYDIRVFNAYYNDNWDIDIIGVSRLEGMLAWWENDGAEQFTRHVLLDDLPGASSVTVTNLTGDTRRQIVVSAYDAGLVLLLREIEAGEMEYEIDTLLSDFAGAIDVLADDLDGDGDFDLAAAANESGELALLENLGVAQGVFQLRETVRNLDGIYGITSGDLDNDDVHEIAAAVTSIQGVPFWRNRGDFSFSRHTVPCDTGTMTAVDIDDIDGDGVADIIAAAYTRDEFLFFQGLGGLAFELQQVPGTIDFPRAVQIVDLDRDGDLDLVGCGYSGDELAWWENDLRPSAFTLLSPEPGFVADSNRVLLRWEESVDPDGVDDIRYDVYVSPDSTDPGEPVAVGLEDSTFLYEGERSSYLFWTVFADDNHTGGTWADTTWSFWIGPTILRPDSFSILSPPNNYFVEAEPVRFTWETAVDTDEGDSVTYIIEMAETLNFDSLIAVFNAGTDTFMDVSGIPVGTPYWRVYARDTNTEGRHSTNFHRLLKQELTAPFDRTSPPERFSIVSVHPNPFNETSEITISLPAAGRLRVSVHNILGEKVADITEAELPPGTHRFYWQASSEASGVYIVSAWVPGKWSDTRRVLLIR